MYEMRFDRHSRRQKILLPYYHDRVKMKYLHEDMCALMRVGNEWNTTHENNERMMAREGSNDKHVSCIYVVMVGDLLNGWTGWNVWETMTKTYLAETHEIQTMNQTP